MGNNNRKNSKTKINLKISAKFDSLWSVPYMHNWGF